MRPPYDAALVLAWSWTRTTRRRRLARQVMAAARAYQDGACARLVLCGGRLPGHRRSGGGSDGAHARGAGCAEAEPDFGETSRGTRWKTAATPRRCWAEQGRVLVVTSDYHLRRAVMTARRAGLRADGLAAKTTGGHAGKRLTEVCYIADLMLGWQDEGRTRPAWTPRLFARMFGEQAKNESAKK